MAGSVNRAILLGHIGRDADMRFTAGGTAVANFSMAMSEKFTGKDGEKKEITEWIGVVAWGKTAEAIHSYLVKGKQVYVEGRLQTREWTDKEGQKRKTTEVKADRIVLLGGGRRGGSGDAHDQGEAAEDGGAQAEAPGDEDVPF